MTQNIEISPGMNIQSACAGAISLAIETGREITFDFNGTLVIVHSDDTIDSLIAKWRADMDAAHKTLIESPEYKAREVARAEEWKRKLAAHLTEPANTETEMRETPSPQPYTPEQLVEYVASVVDKQHDYGTCVYAMSLAATAAFNYVANKLGVTGFQASCADLDFIRRSRGIKGPFMLIKGEDALYPQYDLPEKLATAMKEWVPWLKEEAAKKLAKNADAHPNVIAHWERLAR